MSVIDSVIQWLHGFPAIATAQRITPDMLEYGDMSLASMPEDIITVYVDGTRDITRYMLFRVRQSVQTHGERLDAQVFMETLEQWVWHRNLRRILPKMPKGMEAQAITVTQAPYMLETDGDTAVYQVGLALNYIEQRP